MCPINSVSETRVFLLLCVCIGYMRFPWQLCFCHYYLIEGVSTTVNSNSNHQVYEISVAFTATHLYGLRDMFVGGNRWSWLPTYFNETE